MGQSGTSLVHVFFGGSFDPPHLGHEQMLLALLRDPLCDFVHLVPTGQNPLKSSSQSLSLEKKIQLMEAWKKSTEIHGVRSEKLMLERLELQESKASFTVDTLGILRSRDPGLWVLCIGADLLRQLTHWSRIEVLLAQLHSVWIFPREKHPLSLVDVPESLRSLTHWRWMNKRIAALSSTELRDHRSQRSIVPGSMAPGSNLPGLASFAKKFY